MKDLILNANQPMRIWWSFSIGLVITIIILSFLIPLEIASWSTMVSVKDKVAYEACTNKANIQSDIYKSYNDLLRCKEVYGIWEKQKVTVENIFKELDGKWDDTLGLLIIVMMTVYFSLTCYVLVMTCDHLGWKRISMVASVISGGLTLIIAIEEMGRIKESAKVIVIVYMTLCGCMAGMFFILAGRKVLLWINEGFSDSK